MPAGAFFESPWLNLRSDTPTCRGRKFGSSAVFAAAAAAVAWAVVVSMSIALAIAMAAQCSGSGSGRGGGSRSVRSGRNSPS